MLVYEKVYEVLKDECRKQLVKGEIKGVSASVVAEKIGMLRSNVVRAFKKLVEAELIYKIPGRPVLYYIDSSVLLYELKVKEGNQPISNTLDDFLLNRSKKLSYKGFYEDEIKVKLLDEMEDYIKSYFDVIQSKQTIEKFNKYTEDVEYIIGVDGGGSKTEAIAYTLDGREISHGYSGFGNIVINREEGLKNIEIAILQCMKDLRVNRCIHIYAGLAGAYTGNNKEIVEKYLRSRFPISVTVISDADLAFYALLKGQDGILTIAGTGSISFGIYKEKYIRAGGWGNILGDKGSGYDIALQALKLIVEEKDDGQSPSYLSREIMRAINVTSIADAVNFVYSSNKSDISSLVPVIVSAANKNDKNSIRILKQASRDLVDITLKVFSQMKIDSKVKIAIRGSILTKIPLVKKDFIRYLKTKIQDFEIVQEDVSPAKGAYYIACKNQK